jgi:hypothetical protein
MTIRPRVHHVRPRSRDIFRNADKSVCSRRVEECEQKPFIHVLPLAI